MYPAINNNGTFTHNSGSVTFNGSGGQAIGGSTSTTFNNLTDANTGAAVSVNTNTSVSGNLAINPSAILSPAAAVIISGSGTLTGNGTAQVTRTAATPDFTSQYTIINKTLTNLTVEYVGGATQIVTALTYGGLKINKASGVSLGGNATVNGTLSFTSGVVTTGANTLSLSSPGSVSQTSGWVAGNFQKNIATGTTSTLIPMERTNPMLMSIRTTPSSMLTTTGRTPITDTGIL
jgi:hypothetical protein